MLKKCVALLRTFTILSPNGGAKSFPKAKAIPCEIFEGKNAPVALRCFA
jgi:hypothetical protein